MIESGDRDRCYYNDFCYRVSDYDIPFNLMISNLVYMIHGIILAFSVLWMEAELLAWCHRLACDRRSESPLPEGQIKLPEHCIECPCIDAHLANMSVPHFRPANQEEAVLLNAEAYKRKYNFSHRQKSRTFCSRIHWSAEYVILQWDKNKMAARTSKTDQGRDKFHTKY